MTVTYSNETVVRPHDKIATNDTIVEIDAIPHGRKVHEYIPLIDQKTFNGMSMATKSIQI